eukprot:CAMPEP_0194366558 /NCGR_PEP_ID=MMETSP0174-20130528/14613_1 /TAXON_ID=216777 /ORGANISM="Proboscia alata, Strain PI-D3" /LENGTH=76 /DNA_ID=CAMNT_0039141819 /DNA_START=28 /DNA_END=258 /DNA_ORIENTATION=-
MVILGSAQILELIKCINGSRGPRFDNFTDPSSSLHRRFTDFTKFGCSFSIRSKIEPFDGGLKGAYKSSNSDLDVLV